MKILYIGLSRGDFARSRAHIDGLRFAGAEVVEFFDKSTGFSKFTNFRRFLKEHKDASVIVVGNPGDILVPFVKMVSQKPLVFDAGWSLYEAEVISRRYGNIFSFTALKFWCIDFFAYHLADVVACESTNQCRFFEKTFYIKKGKCIRLFTGTEEDFFAPREVKKDDAVCTVMFRGGYLPEAGIEHILDAAKILEDEKNIRFKILGRGFLFQEMKQKFEEMALSNLVLDDRKFTDMKEMAAEMAQADIALGQLSDHERLARTIPHKAFEFSCLGIPYVTADTEPIRELFNLSDSVVFCKPANAIELAEKIRALAQDGQQRKAVGARGREVFLKQASVRVLGQELFRICRNLVPEN